MAEKPTQEIDRPHAMININLNRHFIKRLFIIVPLIGLIIAIILISNYGHQVSELRNFKDKQDEIIKTITEKCGNMTISNPVFSESFNKTTCLNAVAEGNEFGVIAYYYSSDILTKKTVRPGDRIPMMESKDEDVPTRIAAVEKYAAEKKRREEAHNALLNACNSVANLTSENCKNAEARYNNEWKAVICDGIVYTPSSSSISGNTWSYWVGTNTPKPTGQCYWR